MDVRMDGRVAVITGASTGLGLAMAKEFAASGGSVAMLARKADVLAAAKAEVVKAAGKTNGKFEAYSCDVSNAEPIADTFKKVVTDFGKVDIVVNNAGISIVKPALEMPVEDWDAVVNTNLRGAWLVAQTAGKRWLMAKRPGVIVNIASILGLRTIGQVAPYNASKAGLIHLTRALAMEWARHDIRVNAICPGYIETEMNSDFWKTPGGQRLIDRIPQRRIGKPEHLDGALLLLASEAGSFMTGSVLTVDGGHTVSSL